MLVISVHITGLGSLSLYPDAVVAVVVRGLPNSRPIYAVITTMVAARVAVSLLPVVGARIRSVKTRTYCVWVTPCCSVVCVGGGGEGSEKLLERLER